MIPLNSSNLLHQLLHYHSLGGEFSSHLLIYLYDNGTFPPISGTFHKKDPGHLVSKVMVRMKQQSRKLKLEEYVVAEKRPLFFPFSVKLCLVLFERSVAERD